MTEFKTASDPLCQSRFDAEAGGPANLGGRFSRSPRRIQTTDGEATGAVEQILIDRVANTTPERRVPRIVHGHGPIRAALACEGEIAFETENPVGIRLEIVSSVGAAKPTVVGDGAPTPTVTTL